MKRRRSSPPVVSLRDLPPPARAVVLRLTVTLTGTPEAERFQRWCNGRSGAAARAPINERHGVAWLTELIELYRKSRRRR